MTVRLKSNKLVVEHFETTEPEIISYFEETSPGELEKYFELSLKIGATALRTVGTTEKIDYIEKEFNKLNEKYNEALTETLENLEEKLEDTIGEEGTLDTIFEDNLGEKGRFNDLLDEHFGENGVLVKDLFNPTNEGTPLYQLRTLLLEEIHKLRSDLGIEEAVDQVIEGTTLKGFEFEDQCESYLEQITVNHMGYELERTSEKTGLIKNSKKGDFTVKISEIPDTEIVLETKDYDYISLPEIKRELEASIENRAASYGIFVSKCKESMPKSVGCFNEYEGKYLVCALTSRDHEGTPHPEILNTALCWARNRLLKDSYESDTLDVNFIRGKLEEIRTKIDRFTQVRTQCTNVEKSVKKIREYADEIQEGIHDELDAMNHEINQAITNH